MKILFTNISDIQPIPPPEDLIRADASVSVPLALSMKRRGHDVYFLCPKKSTVKVKKIFTSTGPLRDIISMDELYSIDNPAIRTTLIMSMQMDIYFKLIHACEKEKFDLVHIHANNPLAELIVSKELPSTPFVFTLHGIAIYPELENRLKLLFKKKLNYFISISDYQRNSFPALKFLRTVHNGVDIKSFSFSEKSTDNMLFAGRLKKSKGIDEAVEIARRTGKKLEIVGAMSMEAADRTNFEKKVREINEKKQNIQYRGMVKKSELQGFYKDAKVFLFPIQWEEPFGLTMIESMASGTPVVAFARGSVSEVIKDGVTGFIINSSDKDKRGDWTIKKTGIEGMIEAVNRIYSMPKDKYLQMRRDCRAHVENNFSIEIMVDKYEKAYYDILKKSKKLGKK